MLGGFCGHHAASGAKSPAADPVPAQQELQAGSSSPSTYLRSGAASGNGAATNPAAPVKPSARVQQRKPSAWAQMKTCVHLRRFQLFVSCTCWAPAAGALSPWVPVARGRRPDKKDPEFRRADWEHKNFCVPPLLQRFFLPAVKMEMRRQIRG